MRNEIIIDGTRHVFQSGVGGFYPCISCSLHHLCSKDSLCERVFGKRGLFRIKENKTNKDMSWKDKNYGKSPFDPDYRENYDAEADKEAYDEACEEREQKRREK